MSSSFSVHQILNNFENSKNQCLGKRDKSSAGRIDPRAVNICSIINAYPMFYTTSSCAGRCYLYQGQGIKATTTFRRYRVSHDKVTDATTYFDLSNLQDEETAPDNDQDITTASTGPNDTDDQTIWLRYESFILHVACRSMEAAGALMAAARPSFKNVGLTAWKDGKFLVLIMGDESLEMPLTNAQGTSLVESYGCDWLAAQVNERHERNWAKIDRFVECARNIELDDAFLAAYQPNNLQSLEDAEDEEAASPRSFDVIGDIAVINALDVDDECQRRKIGETIMKKNKAIKLVVARESILKDSQRAPGSEGMAYVAGFDRSPLITTHCEFGIKCVVDLEKVFFSPRMAAERLRICQQVSRGEDVLVLFSGVGIDAFHIVGRTEAKSVLAIDMNKVAMECAARGKRMLERNKSVKVPAAADRLELMEGDVLAVLPTLKQGYYDRVLAPRPKEGAKDGDLSDGAGGMVFLRAILPVLKPEANIHWFDFVADHEVRLC
jgi:tRNA G37 N-methylase Trm5/tRNA(Phe) wybutosine-synthesizing methylase Tyw3